MESFDEANDQAIGIYIHTTLPFAKLSSCELSHISANEQERGEEKQREGKKQREGRLVVDPIDRLGVSEAVADVRIVEIASAGLGECRAAIGHFAGADHADMTDAMRVFPYGNGRLALVGGALGFFGRGLSPTVSSAVLVEPVVGCVGGEFACAACTRRGGIAVAVDPVRDLSTHRFGGIPCKNVAVGFAQSLAIFGVAPVVFNAKLIDDSGVFRRITTAGRIRNWRVDGCPRVHVVDGTIDLTAGDVDGVGAVGLVDRAGRLGRLGRLGGTRAQLTTAIGEQVIHVEAEATDIIGCTIEGVAALFVGVVDHVLVGAEAGILCKSPIQGALRCGRLGGLGGLGRLGCA